MFDAVIKEKEEKEGGGMSSCAAAPVFLVDAEASAYHYRHTLDLTPGVDKLFKGLRDSTRRNIRKAEKEGVEIRFESGLAALREFYRLNCLTRREHGLPPQPWRFFVNLHEEIITGDAGIVSLGLLGGRAIAANVYMHANGGAVYKYGASGLEIPAYEGEQPAYVGVDQALHFARMQAALLRPNGTRKREPAPVQVRMGVTGADRQVLPVQPCPRMFPAGRQGCIKCSERFFSSVPLYVSRAIGARPVSACRLTRRGM